MMRAATLATFAAVTAALAGCGQGGGGSGGAAADDPHARALVAELPPAYRGADLENGRLRFQLCRSCHTAVAGGPDMTGPNLHGVFGRRVATRPSFAYSPALRGASFAWDADHLDRWLTKPRAYLPGTRMSFVGIKDDKDRRDLIAYLKVLSSEP